MADRERTEFLGIRFDQVGACAAVKAVVDGSRAAEFSYLVTPNVDHLVKLHRAVCRDALWQAYDDADLCLCDSRILQMLARWSGVDLQLVPGSDLTALLLELPAGTLRSIAVVGGTAKMVADLATRFPDVTWRHHGPPMGVANNPVAQEDILCFVEEAACDVTFLAIGAPQSELLCRLLAQRPGVRGIALCVGASLEFVTGAKPRAPLWMQQLRLEWLFRLMSEPRRLARRYLLDGPEIFTIWYRWRRDRARRAVRCDSSAPGAK